MPTILVVDDSPTDLRRLSGLHVSFVDRHDATVVVHASTLDAADRATLARELPASWA